MRGSPLFIISVHVVVMSDSFCHDDCFHRRLLTSFNDSCLTCAEEGHNYANQNCYYHNRNYEPKYNHSDAVALMNNDCTTSLVVAIVVVPTTYRNNNNGGSGVA